jgi:hypothetical protein
MSSHEHKFPQRPRTFGLATLMILVAVAAVWFGLLRKSVPLGIAFTPVLPALVALGIVNYLCKSRGAQMTFTQRVGSFFWFVFTSFIWILVGSIAGSVVLGAFAFLFVTMQWATGLDPRLLISETVVLILSVIVHAVVLITVLCLGLRVQIREESPPQWSPSPPDTKEEERANQP